MILAISSKLTDTTVGEKNEMGYTTNPATEELVMLDNTYQ
jgi:hypothetical protein